MEECIDVLRHAPHLVWVEINEVNDLESSVSPVTNSTIQNLQLDSASAQMWQSLTLPALEVLRVHGELKCIDSASDFVPQSQCHIKIGKFVLSGSEDGFLSFLKLIPSLEQLDLEWPNGNIETLLELLARTEADIGEGEFLPNLLCLSLSSIGEFSWASMASIISPKPLLHTCVSSRPLRTVSVKIAGHIKDGDDRLGIDAESLQKILKLVDAGARIDLRDDNDQNIVDAWINHFQTPGGNYEWLESYQGGNKRRVLDATAALDCILEEQGKMDKKLNTMHDPLQRLPEEITSRIFGLCFAPIPVIEGSDDRDIRYDSWTYGNDVTFQLKLDRSPSVVPVLVKEWLNRSGDLPLAISLQYYQCGPKAPSDQADFVLDTFGEAMADAIHAVADRWSLVSLQVPSSYMSKLCIRTSQPNFLLLHLEPTNLTPNLLLILEALQDPNVFREAWKWTHALKCWSNHKDEILSFLKMVPSMENLKLAYCHSKVEEALFELLAETAAAIGEKVFLPNLSSLSVIPSGYPCWAVLASITSPKTAPQAKVLGRPLHKITVKIQGSIHFGLGNNPRSEIDSKSLKKILDLIDSGLEAELRDCWENNIVSAWIKHYETQGGKYEWLKSYRSINGLVIEEPRLHYICV
ncbi:hypothetical protein CPB83DRAFT_831626 [Crepidotus variabilis]|uniref:Uncharacterized protein n=1 Tax=Crepidotus variabilis TaxID=179855 RepID=A0A9P6JVT7_9AGAR|nr:hypothetical protein CPB83DRAFT_831626 [Crepidotus variabilis]